MDTVFKSHSLTIDYTFGESIYLIPFGDVHRDTASCDVDRWQWFLKCCKEYPQDKTWYLGMGDFNDFASTRERKRIEQAELHDTTRDKFDNIVQSDNRKFAEEISFMRGRMIGLLDGNHNWVFRNGKTATEDMAERLGCEYLGWLSHITMGINLLSKTGKKRSAPDHLCPDIYLYVVACHGKAGGKLMGTSINQVDDLTKIFPTADLYCMGHDHQRYAVPKCILLPGRGNSGVKQKRQFLARSGSFKKGYCDGVSGYEVGRLLRPSDMGGIAFKISIHRDTRATDRLITDIQAII